MTNWNNAREKARALVARYDFKKPPINVFEIAENEGIKVVFFNPDGQTSDVSGLLEKDKKKIYLNATESPQRQAFTLAHELAHYYLDHKPDEYGVLKRNVAYADKPPKEKEADMFAAELLMPTSIVIETKKKYHLSDDDYDILAAMFAVSESAMKFRLKSLKSKHGNK
jgi:Zn-dependent peptidase ImmA (M78 family)